MSSITHEDKTKCLEITISPLLYDKLVEQASRENTDVNNIINILLEKGSHRLVKKRCKNCGNWFFTHNRTDELYCEKPAPQDNTVTCQVYGTRKLWYDNLDEAGRLHRRIYSRKKMRIRRSPDSETYKTDFENYKEAIKIWKLKIKNGIATENDFFEWLKTVDN